LRTKCGRLLHRHLQNAISDQLGRSNYRPLHAEAKCTAKSLDVVVLPQLRGLGWAEAGGEEPGQQTFLSCMESTVYSTFQKAWAWWGLDSGDSCYTEVMHFAPAAGARCSDPWAPSATEDHLRSEARRVWRAVVASMQRLPECLADCSDLVNCSWHVLRSKLHKLYWFCMLRCVESGSQDERDYWLSALPPDFVGGAVVCVGYDSCTHDCLPIGQTAITIVRKEPLVTVKMKFHAMLYLRTAWGVEVA
jgi:hypothetical protein